jgi:hypothetical protein
MNATTARTAQDAPSDLASEAILLLRHVYLEAGLPPRAAMASAEADYVCNFTDQTDSTG